MPVLAGDQERARVLAEELQELHRVDGGPDDEGEVTGDEWEAAWSAEIDRRVREVDDGSAELLDGDAVLAEARAWLDALAGRGRWLRRCDCPRDPRDPRAARGMVDVAGAARCSRARGSTLPLLDRVRRPRSGRR
jgi:hypothetical protein